MSDKVASNNTFDAVRREIGCNSDYDDRKAEAHSG